MDSKKLNKVLVALLGAALIYIIILQGCGGSGGEPCPEIVAIDTTRNETRVDTIYIPVKDSTYKYITVRVPVPYYDTTHVFDTIRTHTIEDFDDLISERPMIYEDSVSDDTVSIHYRIRTWGFMDKIEIGYRVHNPYYIREQSIIETTLTKAKKLKGLFAGLDAGMNKQGLVHLEPSVELVTYKNTYNIGYDMVDGAFTAGVRFRIRFGRKD